MNENFIKFEKLLFSGRFFESGGTNQMFKLSQASTDCLIASFLDLIYGVNPILSYESLKAIIFKEIIMDGKYSPEFITKSKILYMFAYGYSFIENGPTDQIQEFIVDLDEFFANEDQRSKNHVWYVFYLGQKYWLLKYSQSHAETQDGFHLALEESETGSFLQAYLYLTLSYASVLKRDLISLKLYLSQSAKLEITNINPWLLFHYYLLQSLYWFYQGSFENSLDFTQLGMDLGGMKQFSNFPNIVRMYELNAGTSKQRVVNLVKQLQGKIEEYEKSGYFFGKCVVLSSMAMMYYNIKFYSNYQSSIERELELIHEHDFVERAIFRHFQHGNYFLTIRNEPDRALDYFSKVEGIVQERASKESFLYSYSATGFARYHQFKGEFNLAVQQYNNSILPAEASSHFKTLARSQSGIAVNMTNQGNFKLAYERLKKATDYFYLIRHTNYTSWLQSLLNMAILLIKTQRINEASQTLESIIRHANDPQHSVSRMIPIRARLEEFKILASDTETKDLEKHYNMLEDYYRSNTDLSPVKHYRTLIEAIKFKNLPRLEHKIEALRLYRSLTEVDLTHDLKVEIYLSLIQILGMEYKINNEMEVREEIIRRLDELYAMSIGGNNFYIIVHYFILNAKIEMQDREFKAADGLLENAQNLCEKSGLTHLLKAVKEERENLKEFLTLWDESLQTNQHLLNEIRKNHLDDYIRKMTMKSKSLE